MIRLKVGKYFFICGFIKESEEAILPILPKIETKIKIKKNEKRISFIKRACFSFIYNDDMTPEEALFKAECMYDFSFGLPPND